MLRVMSCRSLKDSQLQIWVDSDVTAALPFLDSFSFLEILHSESCHRRASALSFLWDASIKRPREKEREKSTPARQSRFRTDKLEELVLMTGLEQLCYRSYHSECPLIILSEHTGGLSVEVSTQNKVHWSISLFFFLFQVSVSKKTAAFAELKSKTSHHEEPFVSYETDTLAMVSWIYYSSIWGWEGELCFFLQLQAFLTWVE